MLTIRSMTRLRGSWCVSMPGISALSECALILGLAMEKSQFRIEFAQEGSWYPAKVLGFTRGL